MNRYRVVFEFIPMGSLASLKAETVIKTRCSLILPDNFCISDLKDGFWINDKLQYTFLSDCKYWIPPSRILYVQKLDREEAGE